MYGTKENTHRQNVSVSSDTKTLKIFAIGSAQGCINQTTVTTLETWAGLSYSDASSLIESSETSVLNGITRQYLGGVRLTIGGGGVTAWAEVDQCWGTRITTSIQRMSDTNLYSVQKQTQVMTISTGGTGTPVYL